MLLNALFFLQGIGTSGSQFILSRFSSSVMVWNGVLIAMAVLLIPLCIAITRIHTEGKAEVKKNEEASPENNVKKLQFFPIAMITISLGFYLIAEHGLTNYLIKYGTDYLKLTAAAAGLGLSLYSAGIMVGRLVLGQFVDRIGAKRMMLILLVAAFAVTAVVFTTGILQILFLTGLSVSLVYPTTVAMVRKYAPASLGARATTVAVSAASLVLTPLVPSTSAKLGVLSPFTASLAGEAGIQPHSRGMKGLWFVLFNICYVSAFCVLTGSNGNFLILGFAPEDQAAKFTWLYWLLMCIVWLVVMVLLSILFVVIFMKPEQPITVSKDTVRQRLEELGPMSKDEKFCVAVLVCAVALWITESYHGIGTVVVAWAALLAMMVRGLFTSKDISRLPWQFFMFLAGLLGMADYMGSSGVSEWFSGVLAPVVGKFIPNSFVFVIVLVIVRNRKIF